MNCFSTREKIVYEYNGIVITRIYKNAEGYFYYGKHEINDLPNSYIKVQYAGFDVNLFCVRAC